MDRIYDNLLRDHFKSNTQMAFISGPRQVGKTTTSKAIIQNPIYINYDNQNDRLLLNRGYKAVADNYFLSDITNIGRHLIFDELHKYRKWKSFLKGFYDIEKDNYKISVTGSARLNIYKKGGDSLMGRYFNYRMHPLSVAEILSTSFNENLIKPPQKIEPNELNHLIKFGGFPEPYLKSDTRFYNRWKNLRLEQLFKEDIRDVSNVQELNQISLLAELLNNQTGQLVNYSSLASELNSAPDSIRRWIALLEQLYFAFTIRPWFRNIPKTLRKQPKIYLWDWSLVKEEGARYENFIASHLLKAVHFWSDAGFGQFGLYFLRDKTKREVDFLIVRNDTPWLLVEVKSADNRSISSSLHYFSKLLQIKHAFQVYLSADFSEIDCFRIKTPIRVPAGLFLSQLI